MQFSGYMPELAMITENGVLFLGMSGDDNVSTLSKPTR